MDRIRDEWRIKWYIFLHLLIFVYAVSAMLGKKASGLGFLSMEFLITYSGIFACMGIYAVGWQQVIKRLPLISAYASRAATVIWGMLFGHFLYSEPVSVRQVIAAIVIAGGIVCFSFSECNIERKS